MLPPPQHPTLRGLLAALTFATVAAPGFALAQSTVSEAQILAGPCASCHGPAGQSPGAIPSIAGLTEADLTAKLTAFRDSPPAGTTVMTRHMKGYDDGQIAALAKYFAEVEG
ncbi:c-type cytochrome [Paracoccus sp. IB05]|uniref:c-type cytochrome n=1 Tax=Paracoccus sp. IB05 TaxID=2779367 RepID=UPI0018E82A84|nr:c-type cytochrome [Paracoccus sp. IB05]MBJ2151388.1 c-type cytochrome [Paracoccus sp. IB05]